MDVVQSILSTDKYYNQSQNNLQKHQQPIYDEICDQNLILIHSLKIIEDKFKKFRTEFHDVAYSTIDRTNILDIFWQLIVDYHKLISDYLNYVQNIQLFEFLFKYDFSKDGNYDGTLNRYNYIQAMFYRNLIQIHMSSYYHFFYLLNMMKLIKENSYIYFSHCLSNRRKYINYLSKIANNFDPDYIYKCHEIVKCLQTTLIALQLNKNAIDAKNYDLKIDTVKETVDTLIELKKVNLQKEAINISNLLEGSVKLQSKFDDFYVSLHIFFNNMDLRIEDEVLNISIEYIKSDLDPNYEGNILHNKLKKLAKIKMNQEKIEYYLSANYPIGHSELQNQLEIRDQFNEDIVLTEVEKKYLEDCKRIDLIIEKGLDVDFKPKDSIVEKSFHLTFKSKQKFEEEEVGLFEGIIYQIKSLFTSEDKK